MRVMFPEGSGGPFLVPGVGPVNGGEPFDWPDELPPVAGCVPAGEASAEDGAGEAAQDAGSPAETAAPGDPQAAVEAAEGASAPPPETDDKTRAKGTRR